MLDTNIKKWYLVQYKHNSMSQALSNLHRQGIELFFPQINQTFRKGNSFKTKNVPLFPGYIFINLNHEKISLNKINSTYGISRLVSFGKNPAVVPFELIKSLKKNCDAEDNFISTNKYNLGDFIEIKNGPFSKLIGKIFKIESDKRIWILLEMMNSEINIISSSQSLKKIQ